MFDQLKKAGVRATDVARLLQISRVAVSLWFNGHSNPHRLIAKRVDRLVRAVVSAESVGDLPLRDVKRDDRYDALTRVIEKHLTGLGLAPINE